MDKYEVCGACNGHKWLVWAKREGYPTSPFIEPCQFCNSDRGNDKPEQPPLTRPRRFIVGGVEVG